MAAVIIPAIIRIPIGAIRRHAISNSTMNANPTYSVATVLLVVRSDDTLGGLGACFSWADLRSRTRTMPGMIPMSPMTTANHSARNA